MGLRPPVTVRCRRRAGKILEAVLLLLFKIRVHCSAYGVCKKWKAPVDYIERYLFYSHSFELILADCRNNISVWR